jgi:hypothetical protein
MRFADTPDRVQVVWLFSLVLGFSRLIWGRFVLRQTMPSVLACHRAAFEAIGGVPGEILYDRMKTAVTGEDGIKRHAHAIVPDHFAQVAAPSPEYVQIAEKRITPEALLNLQGKAAHAAPHIGMSCRNPDPNAGRNWDHGFSDRRTAAARPGDAPAGIRTIARSNSTVIVVPATATGAGSGSGCTWTCAKPWPACSSCRRQR